MADSGTTRSLTGWQRAQVLSAAEYVRELIVKAPDDARAWSVYEGLLDVLEPTRRVAREHRSRGAGANGSMWEQRTGRDRRARERRGKDLGPPAGAERRRTQRRSGRERRNG